MLSSAYSLLQVGGHATAQALSRRLLTAGTPFDPRRVLDGLVIEQWPFQRIFSERFSVRLSVTFI
jgi:hypothetical protein